MELPKGLKKIAAAVGLGAIATGAGIYAATEAGKAQHQVERRDEGVPREGVGEVMDLGPSENDPNKAVLVIMMESGGIPMTVRAEIPATTLGLYKVGDPVNVTYREIREGQETRVEVDQVTPEDPGIPA